MRGITLTLALSAMAGILVAADPMLGTWKLNPTKSKFSPGPGPKSSTITYSQDADWIILSTTGVDSEGKPVSRKNRYKTDGKEYPFEGPSGRGKITVKRIDGYNTEGVVKPDGGGNVTIRTAVSPDGKTRTHTVTGVDAKGEKLNHTIVYDLQ